MDHNTVWTLADVAKHLKCSAATFRKRRAELEEAGFPRPLPGLGRIARWQGIAIIIWETEQSTGRPMDGVAVLEAAGIGASSTRLLAARAAAIADRVRP